MSLQIAKVGDTLKPQDINLFKLSAWFLKLELSVKKK